MTSFTGIKYQIKMGKGKWRTVSLDEYVAMERLCGFRPKPGCGPTATASFGSTKMEGKYAISIEGRQVYPGEKMNK